MQVPTCHIKRDYAGRGNEWVVYKQPGIYRRIEGIVQMPLAELQEDLLVEVFDNPDYLLCEWKPDNPNRCTMTPNGEQRRLAACRTGKDGQFFFENIPAGSYELRVSKDQGWSPAVNRQIAVFQRV